MGQKLVAIKKETKLETMIPLFLLERVIQKKNVKKIN
jgi:hypothetical protein